MLTHADRKAMLETARRLFNTRGTTGCPCVSLPTNCIWQWEI